MASSDIDIHQAPLFRYTSISSQEFRLFSFVPLSVQGCDICLTLHVYPLVDYVDGPAYEAISYACGNLDDKVFILLNGHRLLIYRTLYNALKTLRGSFTSQLIWADAICIDQSDEVEKGQQVQMMGHIYRGAAGVRAFLAIEDTFSKILAKKFEFVYNRLLNWDPGSSISEDDLRAQDLPLANDDMWQALVKFQSHTWFKRLWIVQEVVLAQKVTLHYGSFIVNWDDIVNLIKLLLQLGLRPLVGGIWTSITRSKKESGFEIILHFDVLRTPRHSSFTYMFISTRSRKCSNPLDRIYGWYSILPVTVSQQITVDYNPSKLADLWIPYLHLNQIALSEFTDLGSLPMACTHERLVHLPSWASNLESDLDCSPFYDETFQAGRDLTSTDIPLFACSIDRKQIVLNGLQLCQIEAVAETTYESLESYNGNRILHARSVNTWLRSLLAPEDGTMTAGMTLKRVFDALVAGVFQFATLDELRSRLMSFLAFLKWCANRQSDEEITYAEDISQRDYPHFHTLKMMQHAIDTFNSGRRIFRTVTGRIGNGHHTIRAGDYVCVFRTAQAPFVLRERVSDGTYTFVGDAWVEGLMQGEAFDMGLEHRLFTVV